MIAGASRALGALPPCRLRRVQLPAVEAVPTELVGGANLIGETIRVDPALLLRSPTTIPRELDEPSVSAAFHRDRAHEIGAARAPVDPQMVDRPLGMGVKQLIDEADHFDARDGAHQRDAGRLRASSKRDDVSLESLGSEAASEDLGVYGHGRNISGIASILGATSRSTWTKLTARSAHVLTGTPWRR